MRRELFLTALISAFITLLALVPVGIVLYRNLPLRMATVDVQRLVNEHQQRRLLGGVDDDFAEQLSSTLEVLSQRCHCVLVNKAALLVGTSPDYTDWVRKRVQP